MEILAFVLYFVLMLGIGLFFFFKTNGSNESEYFLGGRSMGPWVTAMSAQASDMSGWLLMGFPGSILAFGMGKAWIGIGLALGTIANWLIVAKRLRRFSKAADDSITLPQYLTNRFATANPALKVISAVIFLIAFTVYVASAFKAGTTVFCAVIPWFVGRELLAMTIFAIIILVYTFLGGYKAVCWTDFFQGLLMLIALLAVPIVMYTFGDFDSTYKSAIGGFSAFNPNPFTATWQDIASGLGWGLGYFGMPHILVRFMAIKKPSMVKKSSTVAITWLIITLAATIIIAFLARTYIFNNGTALAEQLSVTDALGNLLKNQNVFIEIVRDIFPPFLVGILLSAIIAASMSTADSQLLVASSSFTSDIYKPIIRKNNASDKELLWVGRIVVIVVTLVAFLISAMGVIGSFPWATDIMAMVENAWGLFGASFGPVVILSLFWKRINYIGAVSGIIAGAVVDIAWLILFTNTVVNAAIINIGVYEIIPGFIAGVLATIFVSLCTKAPGQEVIDIYNRATDNSIDD